MNRKQVAILLALVAVLGGIALFLQKTKRGGWTTAAGPGAQKVLDFPINDVARVVIHSPTSQVQLAKKSDVWTVEDRRDYPANFDQVSALILRLWELRAVQEAKVGPSQFSRLELVEPGRGDNPGTLVELKDKDDKNLVRIIAGKSSVRKMDGLPGGPRNVPAGRYVLALPSEKVSLVAESLTEISPRPESWLKRDFIKIDDPATISLTGQVAPRNWTLTHTKGSTDWKLADAKPNEQIDQQKVSTLPSLISNLNFTDVLPPDSNPQESGLDKPEILTVQTFDRFTYALRIGKPSGENYPVAISVNADLVRERTPSQEEKPEDKTKLDQEFQAHLKGLEQKVTAEKEYEKRIYLISKSSLDPFLKDRAALLAEKKPKPAPSPSPRGKR